MRGLQAKNKRGSDGLIGVNKGVSWCHETDWVMLIQSCSFNLVKLDIVSRFTNV